MTMSLFDMAPLPRHRHTDPQTSVDAGRSVSSGVEEDVFEWYRAQIAGTDDDLVAGLGRVHHGPTLKSARSRLANRGLLVDSGKRRPSARGRLMIVWSISGRKAVS